MITRHPVGGHVTYYGDGPLVDHEGYAVEIGTDDGANLMALTIATERIKGVTLRAELTPRAVREHVNRCLAWLQDHQD